ncbi:MAG: hypothetical protein ACTSRS_22020 [Candidatus Helarchaeota archaeon]
MDEGRQRTRQLRHLNTLQQLSYSTYNRRSLKNSGEYNTESGMPK